MCIFCEIAKGNIPSNVVYEDDGIIAILDLAQTTKGHTLVMPKDHYEDIREIPAEELAKLIVVVRDLAVKITNKLDAPGFNILVNTDEVAGQSVKHLHFHIVPRYGADDGFSVVTSENEYDLTSILETIK